MSRRVSLALKDPTANTKPKVKFPDELIFLDNIKENNIKEIRIMLRRASANIDINKINDSGLTVLHQAVLNNSLELVKLLLESKADINAVDEENWTPLHAAAFMNYYDISEHLLRKGANPLAFTIENERPIDLIEPTNLALISLYLNHMQNYEKIVALDSESIEHDSINSDGVKIISDIFKQNTDEISIIEKIKANVQNNSNEFLISLVHGLFDSCRAQNESGIDINGFDFKCSVLKSFIYDDNQLECANILLNLIASLNLEKTETLKNMLITLKDKNLVTLELYQQWKNQIQARNDLIGYFNEIF